MTSLLEVEGDYGFWSPFRAYWHTALRPGGEPRIHASGFVVALVFLRVGCISEFASSRRDVSSRPSWLMARLGSTSSG